MVQKKWLSNSKPLIFESKCTNGKLQNYHNLCRVHRVSPSQDISQRTLMLQLRNMSAAFNNHYLWHNKINYSRNMKWLEVSPFSFLLLRYYSFPFGPEAFQFIPFQPFQSLLSYFCKRQMIIIVNTEAVRTIYLIERKQFLSKVFTYNDGDQDQMVETECLGPNSKLQNLSR